MYKIIKSGLTLSGRVWVKGDIISDDNAKLWGIEEWFEETKGKTWSGEHMAYEEGEELNDEQTLVEDRTLDIKKSEDEKSDETKEDPKVEIMRKVLEKKKMTQKEFVKLTWQKQCKLVGIPMAKQIRDYDKPIRNK